MFLIILFRASKTELISSPRSTFSTRDSIASNSVVAAVGSAFRIVSNTSGRISPAASFRSLIRSGSELTSDLKISFAVSSTSLTSFASFTAFVISFTASGTALTMFFMIGTVFVRTFFALEITFLLSFLMSAFGSPSELIRFFQAAFVLSMDPWIVLSASLAVVPVMFMFSCTMWIASTMSA